MKKKTLVMSIGLSLILLTIIAVAICFVLALRGEPDPNERPLAVFIFFIAVFPVILEELVLLRSIYKIFIKNLRTPAKICCIISAVLIILALTYQLLVFTNVINYEILPAGPKAASSRFFLILLLSEWPVILISFILGSIN